MILFINREEINDLSRDTHNEMIESIAIIARKTITVVIATLSFTPFPFPFSVLAIALFIYYISVSTGTEARTEVK